MLSFSIARTPRNNVRHRHRSARHPPEAANERFGLPSVLNKTEEGGSTDARSRTPDEVLRKAGQADRDGRLGGPDLLARERELVLDPNERNGSRVRELVNRDPRKHCETRLSSECGSCRVGPREHFPEVGHESFRPLVRQEVPTDPVPRLEHNLRLGT